MENIKLPSTLRVIGSRTFVKCKNLNDVQLPDCLETMKNDCFSESGIEKLILPAEVKEIGSGAFRNCWVLRNI